MFAHLLAITVLGAEPTTWQAPAGNQPAKVVYNGTTILPNGRFLTPTGKRLYTGEDLWQVLLSPDGKVALGFSDNQLDVYTELGSQPQRQTIPIKELAPCGTFTRDGKHVVLSTGDQGALELRRVSDWSVEKTISANDATHTASYLNDVVVTRDGSKCFAVDVAHQRIVVFDLSLGTVIGSQPAGRQPYTLALSPDETRLFVANIGLFDYSVIDKPDDPAFSGRGLSVPPFGFPSEEALKGRRLEGRNVPGLGSPYVPDAQSIWVYDIRQPARPKLAATAKSGLLIHAPADAGKAVGGSAPNELLVHQGQLFVSNANNDSISVFDHRSMKLLKTIKLVAHPSLAKLRGVIPSGMAVDPSGKRLYVCESGLNAVAVIDLKSHKVLGQIPTGWFPMQIACSPDGKSLFVATQKGLGRGPRGAKNPRTATDERYGMPDMPGMIDHLKIPSDTQLPSLTRVVHQNNGLIPVKRASNPIAGHAGKPSTKIKYVVFITKENHTFDGIFGGLKGATGEPDYAEFGMEGWISEKGKTERLPIMPNHIRLAEQFGISDNFYMEPQASGDGHRWLVGVYPSLWTSRVFYAGWNFKRSNDAKGRLVSFGSNGSQIPEDYLENGSMWEHLDRGGITFRNYGEGYELPDNDEGPMANRSGAYTQVNYPMPKVLYDNTCFNFPAYNNYIPDIARADWFVEDVQDYRKKNAGKLPQFMNIAICNDHGAGAMPKLCFPYVCSYMADNDLALGRIVEYLSHQPEWPQMAIFVTQDDSGGDDDHVDRHRSFVLGISPWIKRGYISSNHTSIMSIIKTIYQIFGLGPNNQFDAVAADLSDFFTETPDYTPYTHVPSDPRVFKPEDTIDPTDPKFERRRREAPPVKMDSPEFVEWLRKRGNSGTPPAEGKGGS